MQTDVFPHEHGKFIQDGTSRRSKIRSDRTISSYTRDIKIMRGDYMITLDTLGMNDMMRLIIQYDITGRVCPMT